MYQIRLGTIDQQHAENEWVLRSYTRSAKKQRLAGEGDEGYEEKSAAEKAKGGAVVQTIVGLGNNKGTAKGAASDLGGMGGKGGGRGGGGGGRGKGGAGKKR